jgi:restriction endonuclease S subunit
MQRKIQDIAIVRFGAYIKEAPEGDVCYLQVNNFNRVENKLVLSKPTLELNSKTEKHLLLDGDIVFAAKGTSNFCSVFRKKMGKVVASSSFLVIRVTDLTVVNPNYLYWILNREDTLAFLKANAIGTSIPSISKALIEEYAINIPPMDMQNKIVAITQLQQREQQLHERILNLHNKLIQKQLIEITKKNDLYGK